MQLLCPSFFEKIQSETLPMSAHRKHDRENERRQQHRERQREQKRRKAAEEKANPLLGGLARCNAQL
jgi:hypothetical protein